MSIEWKMLKTGISGQQDYPSIWIDEYGVIHCVWIVSGEIRYSRFIGFAWESLGSSISNSKQNSIYKSCVSIDVNRFPSILYKNDDGLWVTKWNGEYWDDCYGGAIFTSFLGATIVDGNDLRVFLIDSILPTKLLRCFKLTGDTWVSEGSITMPEHDDSQYDLSAFEVSGDFYLFWRMKSEENEYIGHAIYNSTNKEFYGPEGLKIKASEEALSNTGALSVLAPFSSNLFFKTDDTPS